MDPASGIAIPVAFGAGLISFLSPCVLPLVPGYISAVAGVAPAEIRASRVIGPSLAFVASFSAIFIALGLLGQQALHGALTGPAALKISGAVIIGMGVLFVLAPFVPQFSREWHVGRLISRAGRGGPVVTGAAFALAWTPCTGPTLGAITTAAGTSSSAFHGGLLLAVLGLALGGVRASAVAQLLLVALLIVVVVTAVAGSAPAARSAHWTPFAPHGWLSIGRAASTLMLSFVGWEAVAPLTGRLRAGQLSRVIGIAFTVTAVLYMGLAIATVSCLGRGANLAVPLAGASARERR